ncbi:NfeD family protein [Hallella colorans]|uniref:NfeD family protein n=1 Tax=Hallella colorans TaxID=1703337 RepID=UPI0023F14A58|nr:NfeD family protein [Hallella colorans]
MIDYLNSHFWLVWTLITVLALILEVSTGTFYLMCFAIGAACAIIASLLCIPFWMQVVVFIVFSTLSIFAVRPFVLRYLHSHEDGRLSNADALIGKEGLLIEPITEQSAGYVRVDGDEWKAVSADGSDIEKGAMVRVVGRESIIVTVERINQ